MNPRTGRRPGPESVALRIQGPRPSLQTADRGGNPSRFVPLPGRAENPMKSAPARVFCFCLSLAAANQGVEGAAEAPAPAPPGAFAEGSSFEPEAQGNRDLLHPYGIRQIGLDARYLATRPLHLDRRGILKFAATAGTAGALFLLRNRIRDEAQEHRSDSRDRFLQDVRVMGKGAFAPSLASIAYGASFFTDDDREKETAVLLLESMAFTGAGVGLGQFALSSQRPDEGKEIRFFHGRGHGFSGDAGLAASVVPVLRRQYLTVRPEDQTARRFFKRVATGTLYAGAALTAYQRVNADKHWAPDAFLGMVTGLTVGETVVDSHDQARQRRKE